MLLDVQMVLACLGFELTAVLLNKIRVIWKWTRCKCKPHHALRADLQLAQRIIYPNLRAPQWYKHEANVTRSCSNFFSVTQINHNTHENRKKPNHTLKISKGGRRFTSNKIIQILYKYLFHNNNKKRFYGLYPEALTLNSLFFYSFTFLYFTLYKTSWTAVSNSDQKSLKPRVKHTNTHRPNNSHKTHQ